MGEHCFSRRSRLLNASEYQAVFSDAAFKASHRYLLLLATPNQTQHHRLGLVIAKKNVKLAVQRNRIKRLVRESFRHLEPSDAVIESTPALNSTATAGLDIVFLARKGCDQLDNAELSSILRRQWSKLNAA